MQSSSLLGLAFVAWLLLRSGQRSASSGPKFVRWTRKDMKAFMDSVAPTGVKVTDALLVYTAESGLDPHAQNRTAFGLCQATRETLIGLNWRQGGPEFAAYEVPYQAPWIGKLLRQQIAAIGYVPANALELYTANFSPAAAKSRSEVIYRAPSAEYEANKNLDRDHKGFIARADLQTTLDRAVNHPAYKHALQVLAELEAGGKVPRGATETWS